MIELGMQNAGMGVVLALKHFPPESLPCPGRYLQCGALCGGGGQQLVASQNRQQ